MFLKIDNIPQKIMMMALAKNYLYKGLILNIFYYNSKFFHERIILHRQLYKNT